MFIYICHDGYNINPKKEFVSQDKKVKDKKETLF